MCVFLASLRASGCVCVCECVCVSVCVSVCVCVCVCVWRGGRGVEECHYLS